MSRTAQPIRRTLRLTFQVNKGQPRLVSHERLAMICPPSIGEPPEIGKHGGFWLEARDAKGGALFYRRLNDPLATSVAVHSPDGKIERLFGEPRDNHSFEVLLPDDAAIRSVALIGHAVAAQAGAVQGSVTAAKAVPGPSRELARFDIPAATLGGRP